ncbi:MAG: hypothetical protein Q9M41_07225, partial [Paracoccaceae bacterium]|nr:hypothetical protein [Paracoccaceae bacterium]
SEGPLPLFERDLDGEVIHEPPVTLPEMTEGEQIIEDYATKRRTLRRHPLALLRHLLTPG